MEMEKVKRLANEAQSVAFFIHRSRVQRLYRNFLRICVNKEELQQVRKEFKQNKSFAKPANLKEAEAILKRLYLAREPRRLIDNLPSSQSGPLLITQSNARSKIKNNVTNGADATKEEEKQEKIEWPWQRKDNTFL